MCSITTIEQQQSSQSNNASINTEQHNNYPDATIIQHLKHVTTNNANDIVDVAQVVNQVITSCGVQQKLSDSIHAPKRLSVVNLSSCDLHHHLNELRHKPSVEWPELLLITAHSIPRYNRLDKLNHIKELFESVPGYLDLNWQYHDRSTAIMVEFSNQDYSS